MRITQNEYDRVITLSSKDEQPLWAEFDRVFAVQNVAHLFAPHVRLDATSIWDLEWLRYSSPMGASGMVDEIRQRWNRGGSDRHFVEWFAHIGFLLRECKAGHGVATVSFEDLRDDINRDQDALVSLTEEVSAWFFR